MKMLQLGYTVKGVSLATGIPCSQLYRWRQEKPSIFNTEPRRSTPLEMACRSDIRQGFDPIVCSRVYGVPREQCVAWQQQYRKGEKYHRCGGGHVDAQ